MLHRWTQRLQTTWATRGRQPEVRAGVEPPAASRRTEICPPERLYRHSRWRGGLRDWLNTGWDVSSPAALAAERVPAVTEAEPIPFVEIRQEFSQAMDDIDTEPAANLRSQIDRARSPRDLWHLRSALYTLVAMHHSESQAQARMERLNRHFPNRTTPSGLGKR